MRRVLGLAVVGIWVLGCSGGSRARRGTGGQGSDGDAGGSLPVLVRCTGAGALPMSAVGFRHKRSGLVAAVASAGHHGDDALAVAGQPLELRVKLAYGPTSKDLEDEDVRVWLDVCGSWLLGGVGRSDDNGVARIAVSAPVAIGVHDVRFQVAGDGSTAEARLWLLPAGSHLVVTDIDATLTVSDGELGRDLTMAALQRQYDEKIHPGAVDLTLAHAGRGHVVVYLTGRPYVLESRTRGFLRRGAFASGPLVLTDELMAALPTADGVGNFKRRRLQALLAAGFVIDAAYGNAGTDVSAFLDAGLPATSVFIIGKHGGERGTQAVTDWTARAAAVQAGPRVTQPYHDPATP